jgi:phytoene dehydrogenase-like protein
MVCALLAARHGLDVLLVEGHTSLGGGVRTKELTLPGFQHDVCSAVHPFGRCSPILRSLDLESEGLQWVDPEVPLAHPLLGEKSVLLYRSVEGTAAELGPFGRVYQTVMNSLVRDWDRLEAQLLGPALRIPKLDTLLPLARFGPLAASPASWAGRLFGPRGAALWAGLAGHSLLPMESIGSSAVACVLGLLAHKVGWPMPLGGAERISDALHTKLVKAGVKMETGRVVRSLGEIPPHRAVVLDLSAKQVADVAGPRLPNRIRQSLGKYSLGPGIFKADYALSEAVPWLDPRVKKAGTVHVGGHLASIARSERAVWQGRLSEEPFLLAVQPTLFDSTRAPQGQHTFWVYLHTPNGWQGDATALIESQLERYAPGFRDTVLQRRTHSARQFQEYNPNYVGGDILGGANTLWQVIARPRLALDPYHLTGNIFCCSASVPPGGGVHGMGGFHAFESVRKRLLL